MESVGGDDQLGHEVVSSGGAVTAVKGETTTASSTGRWNPTKEQIGILEGLYKEGVRTPTAEQIQEITGRLRAYGHIEGKNVFYWFQNHKARHRQKEKQDSLALLSRLFHHRSRSVAAAAAACAPPNVICGPYYIPPPSELGFYPIHPKVLLPCGVKRRQRSEFLDNIEMHGVHHNPAHFWHGDYYDPAKRFESDPRGAYHDANHRTLPLFPLHPTGILEGSTKETPPALPISYDQVQEGCPEPNQACFDFLSANGR